MTKSGTKQNGFISYGRRRLWFGVVDPGSIPGISTIGIGLRGRLISSQNPVIPCHHLDRVHLGVREAKLRNIESFDEIAKISMADRKRSAVWYSEARLVARSEIDPLILEVGVASGGRLALAGLALCHEGSFERGRLTGFDTFGLPFEFDSEDSGDFAFALKLEKERSLHKAKSMNGGEVDGPAIVQSNIAKSGYLGEIDLRVGFAEDTIPIWAYSNSGRGIDLLSISCNWSAPVQSALQYLLPLLKMGGLAMLDGFFYWKGFRIAASHFGIDEGLPGAVRIGDCLLFRR
jgi:hypothetical protein